MRWSFQCFLLSGSKVSTFFFILLMFEMIPNVSIVRAWHHSLHMLFETTQLHLGSSWNCNQNTDNIFFILTFILTKAQPPSIVNTFNSQLLFHCTIKLNNIPKTIQSKSGQCLSKYGGACQKLICLKFHTPVTIKAHPGASLGGPRMWT